MSLGLLDTGLMISKLTGYECSMNPYVGDEMTGSRLMTDGEMISGSTEMTGDDIVGVFFFGVGISLCLRRMNLAFVYLAGIGTLNPYRYSLAWVSLSILTARPVCGFRNA